MREIFTSGSAGRAASNCCFYPEGLIRRPFAAGQFISISSSYHKKSYRGVAANKLSSQ
jgi:hypothetical protein